MILVSEDGPVWIHTYTIHKKEVMTNAGDEGLSSHLTSGFSWRIRVERPSTGACCHHCCHYTHHGAHSNLGALRIFDHAAVVM